MRLAPLAAWSEPASGAASKGNEQTSILVRTYRAVFAPGPRIQLG